MSRGHQQSRRRSYGRRQHKEREIRRQRAEQPAELDLEAAQLPPFEPGTGGFFARGGAVLRWSEGAA